MPKVFNICNSKARSKNCSRLYAYDKNKKAPLDRRNIGITKPLLIHRVREEEIKKTNNKVLLENTVNNNYCSGGFGNSCANRKVTLFTTDKEEKPDKKTEKQRCYRYCNGYMPKYQAKLQANVGAGDRLSRLKARAIKKGSSKGFRFTFLPPKYLVFDICKLNKILKDGPLPLEIQKDPFHKILRKLIALKVIRPPVASDSCLGKKSFVWFDRRGSGDSFIDIVDDNDRDKIRQGIEIVWRSRLSKKEINYSQYFIIDFSSLRPSWEIFPEDETVIYIENWKCMPTIEPQISYDCIAPILTAPVLEFDKPTCELELRKPDQGWSFKINIKYCDDLLDKPTLKYIAEKEWTFTDNFSRKFKKSQKIYVVDETAPEYSKGPNEITDLVYLDSMKRYRDTNKPMYKDPFWDHKTCRTKYKVVDVAFCEEESEPTYDVNVNKYKVIQKWRATDEVGNFVEEELPLCIRDTTPPVFVDRLKTLYFEGSDINIDCPRVRDNLDKSPTIKALDQSQKWPAGLNSNRINTVDSQPEWDVKKQLYKFKRIWEARNESNLTSTREQIFYVKDIDCPKLLWKGIADNKPEVTTEDHEEVDGRRLFSFSKDGKITGICGSPPEDLIPKPKDPTKDDFELADGDWPRKLTDSDIVFIPSFGDEQPKPKGRYLVERVWWVRDKQGNVSILTQQICIEDKSCPQFRDFPVKRKVNQLVELNPFKNSFMGVPKCFDDLDRSPTIKYEDKEIKSYPEYQSKIIHRTWTITNESGLSSSRVQEIEVVEVKLDDVNLDTVKELVVTEETHEHKENVILSVIVEDGGEGYEPVTTVTVASSGEGAVLTPIIKDGVIVSITVVDGGKGYYPITTKVTVSGGKKNAELTPVIKDGVIESIKIIDGGEEYDAVTASTIVSGGDGAVLTPVIKDGVIVSINIDDAGENYNERSQITITGNGDDNKNAELCLSVGPGVVTKTIIQSYLDKNCDQEFTPGEDVLLFKEIKIGTDADGDDILKDDEVDRIITDTRETKCLDVTDDGVPENVVFITFRDATRGKVIVETQERFIDENRDLEKGKKEKQIFDEFKGGEDSNNNLELEKDEVIVRRTEETTVDKSKDVTGDGVRDSVITETLFKGTRGDTITETEKQFVDKNNNLSNEDNEKVILDESREGKDDDGDLELQDKEVDEYSKEETKLSDSTNTRDVTGDGIADNIVVNTTEKINDKGELETTEESFIDRNTDLNRQTEKGEDLIDTKHDIVKEDPEKQNLVVDSDDTHVYSNRTKFNVTEDVDNDLVKDMQGLSNEKISNMFKRVKFDEMVGGLLFDTETSTYTFPAAAIGSDAHAEPLDKNIYPFTFENEQKITFKASATHGLVNIRFVFSNTRTNDKYDTGDQSIQGAEKEITGVIPVQTGKSFDKLSLYVDTSDKPVVIKDVEVRQDCESSISTTEKETRFFDKNKDGLSTAEEVTERTTLEKNNDDKITERTDISVENVADSEKDNIVTQVNVKDADPDTASEIIQKKDVFVDSNENLVEDSGEASIEDTRKEGVDDNENLKLEVDEVEKMVEKNEDVTGDGSIDTVVTLNPDETKNADGITTTKTFVKFIDRNGNETLEVDGNSLIEAKFTTPSEPTTQAELQINVSDNGEITSIDVINGGAGYSDPTTITLTDRSGLGNGAAAIVVLDGDKIGEITVYNEGSGYLKDIVLASLTKTGVDEELNDLSADGHGLENQEVETFKRTKREIDELGRVVIHITEGYERILTSAGENSVKGITKTTVVFNDESSFEPNMLQDLSDPNIVEKFSCIGIDTNESLELEEGEVMNLRWDTEWENEFFKIIDNDGVCIPECLFKHNCDTGAPSNTPTASHKQMNDANIQVEFEDIGYSSADAVQWPHLKWERRWVARAYNGNGELIDEIKSPYYVVEIRQIRWKEAMPPSKGLLLADVNKAVKGENWKTYVEYSDGSESTEDIGDLEIVIGIEDTNNIPDDIEQNRIIQRKFTVSINKEGNEEEIICGPLEFTQTIDRISPNFIFSGGLQVDPSKSEYGMVVLKAGSNVAYDFDGDVKATDVDDGPIAEIIRTGTATLDDAGDYILTYSATDSYGNTGSIDRIIRVENYILALEGRAEVMLNKAEQDETNPIEDSGLIIDGADEATAKEEVCVRIVDGDGVDYGKNPTQICSTSREYTMTYTVGNGTPDRLTEISRQFTVRDQARRKALPVTAIIDDYVLTEIKVPEGGTGSIYDEHSTITISAPPVIYTQGGEEKIRRAKGVFDFTNAQKPRIIITDPGFGYTNVPKVFIDLRGGNRWEKTFKKVLEGALNLSGLPDFLGKNLVVEKGKLKEVDEASFVQAQSQELINFMNILTGQGLTGFISGVGELPDKASIGKKGFAIDFGVPPGSGTDVDSAIKDAATIQDYEFEAGRATAELKIGEGGVICGVEVTYGGYGYIEPPTITITGGDGKASVEGVVKRGVITSIEVGTLKASNFGYKDLEPGVKITCQLPGGERGEGAVAKAVVTGEQVTSIIVENGGEGYGKKVLPSYSDVDGDLTIYDDSYDSSTIVEVTGLSNDDTAGWENMSDYQSKYYLSYNVRDENGDIQQVDLTIDMVYFCLELKEPLIPEFTVCDSWVDPSITVNGEDAVTGSNDYSYTPPEPIMWKAESETITYTVGRKDDPTKFTEIERVVRKNYKLSWDIEEEKDITENNLNDADFNNATRIEYTMEYDGGVILSFSVGSGSQSYEDMKTWLTGNLIAGNTRDVSSLINDLNEFERLSNLIPLPLIDEALLNNLNNKLTKQINDELERLFDADIQSEFSEKLDGFMKTLSIDYVGSSDNRITEIRGIILESLKNQSIKPDKFGLKLKIFTPPELVDCNVIEASNDEYQHESLVVKGESDETLYTVTEPEVDASNAGEQTVTYVVTKNDDEDITSSINRKICVVDYEVTVNGKNPVILLKDSEYTEESVAIEANGGDKSDFTLLTNPESIDTTIVSDQKVKYTVTNNANKDIVEEADRDIHVIEYDIELGTAADGNKETVYVKKKFEFNDPGVRVTADGTNSEYTESKSPETIDTSEMGVQTLTYKVTNNKDNSVFVTKEREVLVVFDLTLKGEGLEEGSSLAVEYGFDFQEPGLCVNSEDAEEGCAEYDYVAPKPVFENGTLGDQKLVYTVTSRFNSAITNTITRYITVVDTTGPVITAPANETVEATNQLTETEITALVKGEPTATDIVDDDAVVDIVIEATSEFNILVPGEYVVTYTASDQAGNEATPVTRTITVVDTTGPVITAPANESINKGTVIADVDAFLKGNVTANDIVDGDVTDINVSCSPAFDVNVADEYVVTYNASDQTGNEATPVTRTITVVE